MEFSEFDERVRVALVGAGFTPDRVFDTQHVRDAHTARGLLFHDAAATFLRAFGGFVIVSGYGAQLMSTDAAYALAQLSDSELRDLERWVGEPVVVIGSAHGGARVLLLSARGAVFGAQNDILVSYGTNWSEAFARLCAPLLRPYALH